MSYVNRQKFIQSVPTGTEFAFACDLTGRHNEDGSVYFNVKGNMNLFFDNISDFARYYFHNQHHVPHKVSYRVGVRDEEGKHVFFDKTYENHELDPDEDGDSLYTKPAPAVQMNS